MRYGQNIRDEYAECVGTSDLFAHISDSPEDADYSDKIRSRDSSKYKSIFNSKV